MSLLRILPLSALLFAPSLLSAGEKWVEKTLRYDLDGTSFESTLVYDGSDDEARPGILMVPNWMGPTEASLEKAKKVAGDDFVVLMVDMYGVDVRPSNSDEAGTAAGTVRADRELMRARAAKALEILRAQAGEAPLKADEIAAIGFCFGGGTVLELGRSGADLDAIVSFHGDLKSPTLADDAARTKAKVLVLHGAQDPFVPQEHVQEFVSVMNGTEVDWQLVQFSGTVHSFTDPSAAWPGQAEYNKASSERAFEMMDDLFDEIWDLD
jgi:dienelactone hydrolase